MQLRDHIRNNGGFTLLELMTAVTIAAILATLAEPTFRGAVVKGREAALKQDLFTLRDAIDQYRADRGKYPGSLSELMTTGYLRRIPADPFTGSEASWQVIPDQTNGGVFDIHSGSDMVATDGSAYNRW
jgi:general secretion pathway protein G